jgi:hypothetical protein
MDVRLNDITETKSEDDDTIQFHYDSCDETVDVDPIHHYDSADSAEDPIYHYDSAEEEVAEQSAQKRLRINYISTQEAKVKLTLPKPGNKAPKIRETDNERTCRINGILGDDIHNSCGINSPKSTCRFNGACRDNMLSHFTHLHGDRRLGKSALIRHITLLRCARDDQKPEVSDCTGFLEFFVRAFIFLL